MLERKHIIIFFGGVAVGGISSGILWNFTLTKLNDIKSKAEEHCKQVVAIDKNIECRSRELDKNLKFSSEVIGEAVKSSLLKAERSIELQFDKVGQSNEDSNSLSDGINENTKYRQDKICSTDKTAEMWSRNVDDVHDGKFQTKTFSCTVYKNYELQPAENDVAEENSEFQSAAICITGENAELRSLKRLETNKNVDSKHTCITNGITSFQFKTPGNSDGNTGLQSLTVSDADDKTKFLSDAGEKLKVHLENVYATGTEVKAEMQSRNADDINEESVPRHVEDFGMDEYDDSRLKFCNLDENCKFQPLKLDNSNRNIESQSQASCDFVADTELESGEFGNVGQHTESCSEENSDEEPILESTADAVLLVANRNSAKPETVYVISDPMQFYGVIERFLTEVNNVKILGFDCEWTSSKNKPNPVALVQMATFDNSCYLLRTNKLNSVIPKMILDVLQDKAVLKVGVGVMEDARKLLQSHGIRVHGCIDLRAFALRCQTLEARSLKSLAKEVVGLDLDKSNRLRCSNWDASILTDEQIKYAAFDAFAALKIFNSLMSKKLNLNPSSRPELNKATQGIFWSTVCTSVQGLVDVPFKEKKSFQSIKCKNLESNASSKANSSKGVLKNSKIVKSMRAYSTRIQPLYDNCKMEAPDGKLLSTCDKKKVMWYIQRNLADMVCEDPLTIRLRFQPSGKPDSERDYYLHEKENKCVVCGSSESFVRKNIVPHEYRRHFALPMKDHMSHDILLMCLPCHQQSNHYDCVLRRELADKFQAPQGSIQSMRLLEDEERRSVRSAGKALLQATNILPVDRREMLKKTIIDFYKASEISWEMIKEASELETRIENEAYVPHGEKVIISIYKLQGVQGVLDFAKKWREHFVTSMKPKFLPLLWSVDHNNEKVKRKWGEMDQEYRSKIMVKAALSTR